MGQREFTMTETLAVIAIIAVLSAIAIPSLYKMSQSSNCKKAAWAVT